MIHEILPVGMLQCNCSILGDEASGEAVVIDPGDEIERVQEVLARHHLKVKYIVATHAHIDHVGGIDQLHRATAAPVLMHETDLPLYENMAIQAAWLGVQPPQVVELAEFLKEGDVLRWGGRCCSHGHGLAGVGFVDGASGQPGGEDAPEHGDAGEDEGDHVARIPARRFLRFVGLRGHEPMVGCEGDEIAGTHVTW